MVDGSAGGPRQNAWPSHHWRLMGGFGSGRKASDLGVVKGTTNAFAPRRAPRARTDGSGSRAAAAAAALPPLQELCSNSVQTPCSEDFGKIGAYP
eukprot:1605811-Pyramimonas_sp.AAC.1